MAFSSVKNYYEILGVNSDANYAEIKTAYRKLARKYHPDVNKEESAIEIFKDITLAYETLSNENERKRYDIINGIFKTEEKKEEPIKEKFETKNDTTGFEKKAKKEKTTSNFFKFILAKLKKSRLEKEFHKPKKGENITTDIVITPDEVMTGSKRIVNIRTTRTCPKCNGHRFANGDKCAKCGGKGTVTETKKITVTIPKGVKHGAKLRLKGEGASGKNGGANGDVLITVKVETKTQVYYDKLNIYYNVPITPYEAALGEEISIPAFDGIIKLKLPKNTCSGQKFRISKQGIKKNGKIGDLIVTVSIEFSSDLSQDEIKLYEELKNLSHDNIRKNFGYGS